MFSRKWLMRVGAAILAVVCVTVGALAIEGEAEPLTKQTALPLSGGMLEANSNRQVHPFSEETVVSPFTTEGFEKVGQTDELEVYLHREEGALRIMDRRTGYLWGAVSTGEAEGLNSTWRCYANGLVSIECFNSEGVESRLAIGKDGVASYTLLENGLLCDVSFPEQGIAFQVRADWSGNTLSMEIVDGSLKEGLAESAYTLKSVTFLPFLGSSYSDSVDGYMLIPDGCGALIRYLQPGNYSSTYAARIYGTDYGIGSLASTAGNTARQEQQILMPVYGMIHGAYQNGYLAVVEGGAEYASILATPAQTNNPYNWAAARFEYRQKYIKNINRKEGAGASIPQETANVLSPKISFHFLHGEEANYDGMAVLYRQMLIMDGVLTPITDAGGVVPLQLEVIGAGRKEGLLWDTTEVFTTAAQAQEIAERLQMAGIGSLDMVLRGYTRNNEAGEKLLKDMGAEKDFAELEESVTELGGSLYYYFDPATANEDQIHLRSEAANSLSRSEIRWNEQAAASMYSDTYLYRLSEARQRTEDALASPYGGNLALAQLSNKLYSDFTSGKEVTRAESLELVWNIADSVAGGGRTAFYRPNQYLWTLMQKAYDLPVANSQIIYESDSVPFLQIVLSGCVELYGSTINTSLSSTERLLRQIEYGMAPAFIVTGCESAALYNTAWEGYFSTSYADWEPQILEAYETVAKGLSPVWGHSIVAHTCLTTGLIRVTYDNDVQIYLNYTDAALTRDGVTVPAGDFLVIGG